MMLTIGHTAAEERQTGVDLIGDVSMGATDEESHTCLAPSTLDGLLGGDVNIPAECDNGDFVRVGFSMGHGFSELPYAQEGWTGHLESWLVWSGADRGFRCTFNGGALVQCQGLGGAFPSVGAEFQHLCLAYESGTGSELPIAETNWGCRVFGLITASG